MNKKKRKKIKEKSATRLQLEQKLKENLSDLKTLPTGRLSYEKNPDRYFRITKNSNSKSGRSKKGITNDKPLIYKLARKQFLLTDNKFIKEELAIIKELERLGFTGIITNLHTANDVLNTMSTAYRKLPLEAFFPDLEYANYLEREKISTNPNWREGLKHKNNKGHEVRSKSEAIICDVLDSLEIPYIYEKALSLDGITYYPDFTIYNPNNGKTYYLEHFGMMYDPKYVQNSLKKVGTYIENNIVPWDNLIITYEPTVSDRDYLISQIKYYLSK